MTDLRRARAWQSLNFGPCEQCDAPASVQVGLDPPSSDNPEDRVLAEVFGPHTGPPTMLLCAVHARKEGDRRLDEDGYCNYLDLRENWSDYFAQLLPFYGVPQWVMGTDGQMVSARRIWFARWECLEWFNRRFRDEPSESSTG